VSDPRTTFATPSEITGKFQSIAPLSVPYPSSWADEERDLSAWLGNEMQKEAFNKLYSVRNLVEKAEDPDLAKDWAYLQASDHFYYMSTKYFSDQAVHNYFNPYDSPYDAFINYMNILSDFILRLEKKTKRMKYKGIPVDELAGPPLDEAIETYEDILKTLRKRRNSTKKSLQKADPVQTDLPKLATRSNLSQKKGK
jgi:alpha-amylase